MATDSDLGLIVDVLIGDGLAFDSVAFLLGLPGLEVRQAWMDRPKDSADRRFGPVSDAERRAILQLYRRSMPIAKIAHVLRRRRPVIKSIINTYCR